MANGDHATAFTIGEILSSTSVNNIGGAHAHGPDDRHHSVSSKNPCEHQRQLEESFDSRLRAKLGHPRPGRGRERERRPDDATFDDVHSLFRNAAAALKLEIDSRNIGSEGDRLNLSAHCHWVPGRIEVMGKHTDYAGGNSLVCAMAGRGMSMVSTFVRSTAVERDDWMNVTIVSVLPRGMEHHATRTTAVPYKVAGRPVVHHTINIHHAHELTTSEIDDGHPETEAVDWTVYPTAVIHRLHKNFCLFPHANEQKNTLRTSAGGGGHIFIALSSNLPPASGLSTSSAFVTGLFLVLNSHLSLVNSSAFKYAIGEDGDSDTIYNLSTYLGNVENGRDYVRNDVVLKGTVQGGVGTFGGSEDHAAILMGRSSELRLLSFCPTRPYLLNGSEKKNYSMEKSVVKLSSDLTFVIAYSGAKAEKAGGTEGVTNASVGYNTAAELARQAFDAYFEGGKNDGLTCTQTLADAITCELERSGITRNLQDQSVKKIIAKRIEAGAKILNECASPEEYSKALVRRFEHFYDESVNLVPAAARALLEEKYEVLGTVVDASHRGAVNCLSNQIEETAWLPLWARGCENDLNTLPLSVVCPSSKSAKQTFSTEQPQRMQALAASAFGAGFGGSCWALVHRIHAKQFAAQWRQAYDERFPPKSKSNSGLMREFFLVDPGPGAFHV